MLGISVSMTRTAGMILAVFLVVAAGCGDGADPEAAGAAS